LFDVSLDIINLFLFFNSLALLVILRDSVWRCQASDSFVY